MSPLGKLKTNLSGATVLGWAGSAQKNCALLKFDGKKNKILFGS